MEPSGKSDDEVARCKDAKNGDHLAIRITKYPCRQTKDRNGNQCADSNMESHVHLETRAPQSRHASHGNRRGYRRYCRGDEDLSQHAEVCIAERPNISHEKEDCHSLEGQ